MKKKSNRDGTQYEFIFHTMEKQTSKIISLLHYNYTTKRSFLIKFAP